MDRGCQQVRNSEKKYVATQPATLEKRQIRRITSWWWYKKGLFLYFRTPRSYQGINPWLAKSVFTSLDSLISITLSSSQGQTPILYNHRKRANEASEFWIGNFLGIDKPNGTFILADAKKVLRSNYVANLRSAYLWRILLRKMEANHHEISIYDFSSVNLWRKEVRSFLIYEWIHRMSFSRPWLFSSFWFSTFQEGALPIVMEDFKMPTARSLYLLHF